MLQQTRSSTESPPSPKTPQKNAATTKESLLVTVAKSMSSSNHPPKIEEAKLALGLSGKDLNPVYRSLRAAIKAQLNILGLTSKTASEKEWNDVVTWATKHKAFESTAESLFKYNAGDKLGYQRAKANMDMLSLLCRDACKKSQASLAVVDEAIRKNTGGTWNLPPGSAKKRVMTSKSPIYSFLILY